MATYTPNLNLGKPEATDPFGDFRELFNDNMDKLDQGGGGDVMDVEVNGTSVVDPVSKVAEITMPTKVSDLLNDAGFITSTVANLTNYYTKSETYTQNEVDALISAITTLNLLVVQTLPVSGISQTTIYLVPKQTAGTQDVYDEYINLDGTSSGWEHIGSTEIDLSNYYTKSEVDALLADKADTADLASVATSGSYNDLSDKPTIPDELADLTEDSTHRTVTDTEKATWNAKVSDNPTFTEASARANISSGESFAIILGKIKKFFTDLKTVAFTGSYNDLSDKPTIPSAQVNSDWNASSGVAQILNKPTLATVATSGSYNDLSNKPTIPDISTKVSKSGDTMSGALTIDVGNSDSYLKLGGANSYGVAQFFAGNTGYKANLYSKPLTANRTIEIPNGSGTIALDSEITKVRDYSDNTFTKFGYGSSGMTASSVTWLGAWDASVSGEYRLRAVRQADLRVANADTVDNYHMLVERYASVSDLDQPTAGTEWGVLIKTPDWDANSEVVHIYCTGQNAQSMTVIHLGARSTTFWGYGTQYNTIGVSGAYVTVGTPTNLHIKIKDEVTHVKVYKSWSSGGSVEVENLQSQSNYVTTNHGFFASGYSLGGGTVNGELQVNQRLTVYEEFKQYSGSSFFKFFVNGAMFTTSTGVYVECRARVFTDMSSRRYKENIVDVDESEAKKLLDVRVVQFDYKDHMMGDDRYCLNQVGVIAEEVEEIIPNAVSATKVEEDGEVKYIPDGVGYSKFVPYLIKMVQMQQKEIDELKAIIKGGKE